MKIGVLAIQGDFVRHVKSLESISVDAVEIRYSHQLSGLDGIIIPGGESTTFHIVLESDDLGQTLPHALSEGLPAWGSCAGSIMLGYGEGRPPRWNLINVETERNGYGRQVDSFVSPIEVSVFETVFNGVFIRAPRFIQVGEEVEILAKFKNEPVMVRQGSILATSFHPELTPDNRIHRYFVEQVCYQAIHHS